MSKDPENEPEPSIAADSTLPIITATCPTSSPPHWLTVRGRHTRCSRTSSRSHPAPLPSGTLGRDVRNGKGVIEDIASNIIKMVVNQDFSSGLRPGPLLDYFPYL